jgi:hypothetical protein
MIFAIVAMVSFPISRYDCDHCWGKNDAMSHSLGAGLRMFQAYCFWQIKIMTSIKGGRKIYHLSRWNWNKRSTLFSDTFIRESISQMSKTDQKSITW